MEKNMNLLFFSKISKKIPAKNVSCKYFEVNNHKISEFIFKKIIPIVGLHPFPFSELQMLVSTLCWSHPEYVFDWGTHLGKSARIFYETSKHYNLKTKIVSIDLPDNQKHTEHPGMHRGKYVKKCNKIKLIQGDGVTEAIKICKKNEINNALFFLDGDHSYKTVKRELNSIHKNIENPTILIHDTFFQSKKSKYNTGPHRAINEFVSNKKYKLIEEKLGLPGMTLLYI